MSALHTVCCLLCSWPSGRAFAPQQPLLTWPLFPAVYFPSDCQVTRSLGTFGFQGHLQTPKSPGQGNLTPLLFPMWQANYPDLEFRGWGVRVEIHIDGGEIKLTQICFGWCTQVSHNLANFPFLNQYLLNTCHMRVHYAYPQGPKDTVKERD